MPATFKNGHSLRPWERKFYPMRNRNLLNHRGCLQEAYRDIILYLCVNVIRGLRNVLQG